MQIARRLLYPSEIFASSFIRKEISDISILLRGSNIRWRGRSFVAAVPSDVSKGEKGRKRLSKDVRHAMVESFVHKYRALNAGKFPTASQAKKEVGGSYYVVKQILQEIKHKSQISPDRSRNEHIIVEEVTKENDSLAEVEEITSGQVTASAEVDESLIAVNDVEFSDSRGEHYEPKEEANPIIVAKKTEGPNPIIVVEKTSSKKNESFNCSSTQSYLQREEAKETRNDEKEKSPEKMSDIHGLQPTAENRQDKLEREPSEKQTSVVPLETKPSMWGNLKSLADGIMNMWRKF